MTAVWPQNLKPVDRSWRIENPSRSGGVSTIGSEQVVAAPTGRWRAEITLAVRGRDGSILAHRALMAKLRGRAGTVWVPVCDGRGPKGATDTEVPDDGVPFADGALFADGVGFGQPHPFHNTSAALAGAVSLDLDTTSPAFTIEPGMYFSVGDRLYIVTEAARTGSRWAVSFEPPLRFGVPQGSRLDFANPFCIMRLASDDSGALTLEFNQTGRPIVSLVEAF